MKKNNKDKQKLVSIIIPTYNAEKFLNSTIKCLLDQTYSNFEALFVNDCSKDNSAKIISKYSKKDKRICLINNKTNLGVSETRNNGVRAASGDYICYLDADDMWDPNKLSKQIAFMEKHQCAFSCTSYQFADDKCVPNGRKVRVKPIIDYESSIRNNTIWTSTVMFDMRKITKNEIMMQTMKGEDVALWWRLLRKGYKAYGLNEVLSFYRRTSNTLSSNKITGIGTRWHLYRKVEKLSLLKSCNCFVFYAINGVWRRI